MGIFEIHRKSEAKESTLGSRLDLDAIPGNSRILLTSLNAYLDNCVETLDKTQYNYINRKAGNRYVETFRQGIENKEVKREEVLAVNSRLSDYAWTQYRQLARDSSDLHEILARNTGSALIRQTAKYFSNGVEKLTLEQYQALIKKGRDGLSYEQKFVRELNAALVSKKISEIEAKEAYASYNEFRTKTRERLKKEKEVGADQVDARSISGYVSLDEEMRMVDECIKGMINIIPIMQRKKSVLNWAKSKAAALVAMVA